jgi:hypothetical protein
MDITPDPGGRFKSDAHRRVLGHLSRPADPFGWTVQTLTDRLRPDVHSPIETTAEVQPYLDEHVADGLAEVVGGVYRQTPLGFRMLGLGHPEEPAVAPDPSLVAPALLGGPVASPAGPTPLGVTEVST